MLTFTDRMSRGCHQHDRSARSRFHTRLTRDRLSCVNRKENMPPHIDSYKFGRIEIDGKAYTQDLIILPEGIQESWWRKDGHGLCPDDLEKVMGIGPGTVIIGCGANNVLKVPEKTREWIEEKGAKLIALPTADACDRYNEISGKGKVIAGLHLTC